MERNRKELRQRLQEARKERPRPRPWYQPINTPAWLTEEMIEELTNLPPKPRGQD